MSEKRAPESTSSSIRRRTDSCQWVRSASCHLERLRAVEVPLFVANGDRDPMILPHSTCLLAGLVRQARLKIFPDSAHGFLVQHHDEFAADVDTFLS